MKRLNAVFVLLFLFSAGDLIAGSNNYATYFGASENPISQNSRWVNGLVTGLDWTDIRVDANGARNTQTGLSSPATNDSIAVLTGTWGANQQSEGIVRTTNQPAGNVFEEFELLLRFNVTAHSATGYEVLFSANKLYAQIVRWNGALNTFQVIGSGTISALVTGDVLKATISGSSPPTITGYVNGTSVVTTTDDGSHGGAAYTTGNPGIGLYYQTDSSGGVVTDYSFTSFITTDASIRDAASCSSAKVQSAMTAANTAYDIVSIAKSGSPCHWTAQVTWSAPANAIVQCRSVINSSFSSTNFASPPNDGSVTMIDDYADAHAMLKISGITGAFRQYGCAFEKGTGTLKDQPGILELTGTSTTFRWDHNRINNTTGANDNGSAAKFDGVTGVADHNQVDLNGAGTGNGIKISGANEGNEAWNTATNFGGADYLFFEESYFPAIGFAADNGHSNSSLNDCDHGGKYVYRFNTIGSTSGGGGSGSQTHPTGGSGVDARGCRATEIYANNFQGSDSHEQSNAMYLSSGASMMWHNPTPNGYEHTITIHATLKDNGTYPEQDTPAGWGYCGPARQTGTATTSGAVVTKSTGSNFNVSWPTGDSNTTMIFIAGGASGGYRIQSVDSTSQLTTTTSIGTNASPVAYSMGSNWSENANTTTGGRCLDQPGNGIGDLLTGSAPSKVNSTTGTIAWPNQALEPVYEWWNLPHACSGCDHAEFESIYELSVLVANVNYYLHAGAGTINTSCPTSSTCTPFNGTVGTGYGPLSLRPPLCTIGVGYAVTDAASSLGTTAWNNGSNSLYNTGSLVMQKCTSTNTWTTVYQPYTFPHPLSNGDTSPPAATISSLTPSSGAQGATSLSVAVVGLNSNFVNATTVCYFGANITVNSCTVSTATALTANITIAAGAVTGARDATFTTGAEVATSTGGFTVNAGGILIKKISPRKFRKL